MIIYETRIVIPEAGNKYYNTKSAGGYSDAILGKPTCEGLNVLSNCVGYAVGRFSEIAGDSTESLLKPVNAEDFIKYADKSLLVGTEPKIGACAVWSRRGTHGHVAIVEAVNSDGTIVTSESGYGNAVPFNIVTRNNSNGRWKQDIQYKFLGFIYQPTEYDAQSVYKGCTGDYVRVVQTILKGYGYYSGLIDGYAGKLTELSIKAFQKHSDGALYIDGIFGPKCFAYFMKGGT